MRKNPIDCLVFSGACAFFIKWWNFIRTFASFFLTDWHHIRRENTIEISSIHWNVLLWIFSNYCVNYFFSSSSSRIERLHGKISSGQSGILAVQKRDLTFLRQNFIPAKRDHVTTTWKKLINSHWFKNAHKMMKFYKYISLLFSHRLTSYVSKKYNRNNYDLLKCTSMVF